MTSPEVVVLPTPPLPASAIVSVMPSPYPTAAPGGFGQLAPLRRSHAPPGHPAASAQGGDVLVDRHAEAIGFEHGQVRGQEAENRQVAGASARRNSASSAVRTLLPTSHRRVRPMSAARR